MSERHRLALAVVLSHEAPPTPAQWADLRARYADLIQPPPPPWPYAVGHSEALSREEWAAFVPRSGL